MAAVLEKRGPIEKTAKGWPINPLGVAALIFFALIIIFLIIRPLIEQKTRRDNQQQNSIGGHITRPLAGEIVTGKNLQIEFSSEGNIKVAKVEYWAKTYADGKWQMIGTVTPPFAKGGAPYRLDWQTPDSFANKAIALTVHLYTQDGKLIKDPGGWREGIIILSP